jgi:hypothetical protein
VLSCRLDLLSEDAFGSLTMIFVQGVGVNWLFNHLEFERVEVLFCLQMGAVLALVQKIRMLIDFLLF